MTEMKGGGGGGGGRGERDLHTTGETGVVLLFFCYSLHGCRDNHAC